MKPEEHLPHFMIETKSEAQYERERAENMRIAALLGYGALLAHNTDGKFNVVVEAIDKVLNPKPVA